MLWQRAKTVGMVFHIAKLRTEFEINKFFTRKVANFVIFLLLLRGWVFCSSLKNFLLIDEKGERDFVFASAKNGNECDLKILLFFLVFSIYLFSNTDRCFVCLFVCLFTRARGSIRKVFICITLQHLFWYTKSAVFATQFAHCFCTQFLHHFAYISDTILTAFLMQIGVYFDAIWRTFLILFWEPICSRNPSICSSKSSNYLPQNDTLFAIKRYVIFSKTSRRFQQNDTLFFESFALTKYKHRLASRAPEIDLTTLMQGDENDFFRKKKEWKEIIQLRVLQNIRERWVNAFCLRQKVCCNALPTKR